MLKTVHRRKTKRLLINSTSFLLPLGAGKLVMAQRVHLGLLLGEQQVYLDSGLLVGETWWRGKCANSPTGAQQGDLHRVTVVSQKDTLVWEYGSVSSSLTLMVPKASVEMWRGSQETWHLTLQLLPRWTRPHVHGERTQLVRSCQKHNCLILDPNSGLSAVVDGISALLPGAGLCSRLYSSKHSVFLKFTPGWHSAVYYFHLSNPFLFVYLWQIFADLVAHIPGRDYKEITVALCLPCSIHSWDLISSNLSHVKLLPSLYLKYPTCSQLPVITQEGSVDSGQNLSLDLAEMV